MKQYDKKKLSILLTCIGLIVLLIFGVTSCTSKESSPSSSAGETSSVGASSYQEEQQNKETTSDTAENNSKASSAQEDAEETQNQETWLSVPGTDIDNPVMQHTDNEYYLNRNEQGKYSRFGCYFADYHANLTAKDKLIQNTVIYGHSANDENPDGVKFNQLFRYLDLDFTKQNPSIYLTVGDEKLTFEIFAVFYTDTDFYYIDPQPSDQGFEEFMKTIDKKNLYNFPVSVTAEDKLLTLSTCSYIYDTEETGNHRFVVMGKLTDTPSSNPQITKNPNPQTLS